MTVVKILKVQNPHDEVKITKLNIIILIINKKNLNKNDISLKKNVHFESLVVNKLLFVMLRLFELIYRVKCSDNNILNSILSKNLTRF